MNGGDTVCKGYFCGNLMESSKNKYSEYSL